MTKIKLSIPEPCHQNWDDMTPTSQGRFCNACAKEVIDFSQMSDTDVLNYFKIVKHGKVCGHAYPDQLDRPITNLPAKKLYWYWNYVIALFLLFSKSNTTKAQGAVKTVKLPASKPIKHLNLDNLLQQVDAKKSHTITGIIQAEDGSAVSFATVRLFNSNTGVTVNEQGRFSIDIDSLPCTLEVSSLGFETRQVLVKDLFERKIVLLRTMELMKEVVVTSTDYRITVGGLMITRTFVKRNIRDTLKNWITTISPEIKIYPNPILKGTEFTVGLTLKHTGTYIIRVVNTAGAILLQKQISATAKKHQEQLLGNAAWTAGIYYLQLIDDKGKHIATGNVVVQ